MYHTPYMYSSFSFSGGSCLVEACLAKDGKKWRGGLIRSIAVSLSFGSRHPNHAVLWDYLPRPSGSPLTRPHTWIVGTSSHVRR
jgi:hypothetical protein